MSVLQKTFEKLLSASENYAEFKKNFSNLLSNVNELAQSIVSITQTLQAHHIALGEMIAFQKELMRNLNNPYDFRDTFDDETKLN